MMGIFERMSVLLVQKKLVLLVGCCGLSGITRYANA